MDWRPKNIIMTQKTETEEVIYRNFKKGNNEERCSFILLVIFLISPKWRKVPKSSRGEKSPSNQPPPYWILASVFLIL